MNVSDIINVLKADIEYEIFRSLTEDEFKRLHVAIKQSVENGTKIWREQSLVTLLGVDGAKEFLDELESTQVNEYGQ